MVNIGTIFWFAISEKRIITADQIDPASMEIFKKMHHNLLENNIYLGPSGYEVGFISAAHSEADLDEAVEKICVAIDQAFA
jgi:glutamate-1-semialdehyde 2,1-aminomutase